VVAAQSPGPGDEVLPPAGGLPGVQLSDLQLQGQPGEALAAAATVNSRISYQGVLKESGSPVNGTRNITFTLYSDDGCTAVVDTIVKSSVPITDGLFAVELDVDHGDFDGQGLWLGVEVGGAAVACREVMPVPYALSLRPGAVISDTRSKLQFNRYSQMGWPLYWTYEHGILSEVGGAMFTYGLFGHSTLTGNFGVGVYGQSDSSVGVGTYGYASSASGATYGVYGYSASDEGQGVRGYAAASSGTTYGVYGESNSATSGSYGGYFTGHGGVYGQATDANGWAGYFEGGQGTYSQNGFDTGGGDLAEYFPVREADLEPGDVVVIDPAGGALLTRSTVPYDTALAGVVATAPGLRMGSRLDDAGAWASKERRLIAVVGRVPVKVDAGFGAIRPGDLLTTSPTPGHAMKATEPKIGTILGKALGSLDAGTGVIEVLVTLR